MVYFWQRKHRAALAATPSTYASEPGICLSTSVITALASYTTGQEGDHSHHQPKELGFDPDHGTSLSTRTQISPSKGQPGIASHMLEKLSEYSRRKHESDKRKVAERELESLNMKIDKLLLKMEDTEAQGQGRLRLEDECVVCLAAAATMQTFPCGHKVVCRKCLIKTIQVAVSQRCLPLRCVICRDRILTLHHTTHLHTLTPTTGQSPGWSSSLTSPPQPLGRPGSLPASSPAGLFSFLTSTKCQTSPPRLLSLGATLHHMEAVSRLAIPADEDLLRYGPTDLEAFVSSHNDALNLHKSSKTNECKAAGHPAPGHGKRADLASYSFMHSTMVKIHPMTTGHIGPFMEAPKPDPGVLSCLSSNSGPHRAVGAGRFLSRFLSRNSKRKCSWRRSEH